MENYKVGKRNGAIDGKIQLCYMAPTFSECESIGLIVTLTHYLNLRLISKNEFLLPKGVLTSPKQCVTDKRHATFVMTPRSVVRSCEARIKHISKRGA